MTDNKVKSSKKKDPKWEDLSVFEKILAVGLILGMIAILVWVGNGVHGFFTSGDDNQAPNQQIAEQTNQDKDESSDSKLTIEVPEYEVVSTKNERYDGQPSYYVVLNEFNGDYKNARKYAKGITVDLVTRYGKKISVLVFSNQKAYDAQQRRDNTENICDPECLEKTDKITKPGFIAWYSGFLDTMATNHDMAYFPAATTDHETVGQYAGTEEFIAEDYQPK